VDCFSVYTSQAGRFAGFSDANRSFARRVEQCTTVELKLDYVGECRLSSGVLRLRAWEAFQRPEMLPHGTICVARATTKIRRGRSADFEKLVLRGWESLQPFRLGILVFLKAKFQTASQATKSENIGQVFKVTRSNVANVVTRTDRIEPVAKEIASCQL
jgi:hypothetical protein